MTNNDRTPLRLTRRGRNVLDGFVIATALVLILVADAYGRGAWGF